MLMRMGEASPTDSHDACRPAEIATLIEMVGSETSRAEVSGDLVRVTLGTVVGGAGGMALASRFAFGSMWA